MTVTKRRPSRFTDMHPLITTASGRLSGRLLSLAACALILTACGSAPVAQSSASSPSSAAALSCTISGPASAAWPQPWTRTTITPPIRSAILQGDTLTFSFDSGTPPFQVTPQSSARFDLNTGKGGTIDLAGSAGVRIGFTGLRGDMQNYVGPDSMTSPGPLTLQAHAIGDWEGYVAWAVGTSGSACANVTASGSTLTFRFISLPASPAIHPASSPTALSCTASGPASAAWPQPWTRSTTAPPIRTVTLAGDTLTISFDGGTPPFVVAAQTSPRFYREAGLIDLAGSAGVHIALSGFRGDMVNYDGPRSIASSGPLALQAYNLEDFEGYVGWGVGTSGPSCANVTLGQSTLTFHFIPTPASG